MTGSGVTRLFIIFCDWRITLPPSLFELWRTGRYSALRAVADEHRAAEARQAIDPYSNKT
jgi:hypothetical protein